LLCSCYGDRIISSVTLVRAFFFFQAEDGIRARNVTGVQTCALPISFVAVILISSNMSEIRITATKVKVAFQTIPVTSSTSEKLKIGRASCREGVQTKSAVESVTAAHVIRRVRTGQGELNSTG